MNELSSTVRTLDSAVSLAIGNYVLHNWFRDTDNQFRRPQQIGSLRLPKHALLLFMLVLIAGEIGGFALLFAGALRGMRLL